MGFLLGNSSTLNQSHHQALSSLAYVVTRLLGLCLSLDIETRQYDIPECVSSLSQWDLISFGVNQSRFANDSRYNQRLH